MIKQIVGKILERLLPSPKVAAEAASEPRVVNLAEMLGGPPEPELRVIGLYSTVEDEKIAELTQAILYLNETNKMRDKEKEASKPIEFYINTYGGSADDMFAMYDVMQTVMEDTEIHPIVTGKQ